MSSLPANGVKTTNGTEDMISDGSYVYRFTNLQNGNLIRRYLATGGTESTSLDETTTYGSLTYDGTHLWTVEHEVTPNPFEATSVAPFYVEHGANCPTQAGVGFDGTYIVVACLTGTGTYNVYAFTPNGQQVLNSFGTQAAVYGTLPSGVCPAASHLFFQTTVNAEWITCAPSPGTKTYTATTNLGFVASYKPSDITAATQAFNPSTQVANPVFTITDRSGILTDAENDLAPARALGGMAFDGQYLWIAGQTGGVVLQVSPVGPTFEQSLYVCGNSNAVPTTMFPYGLTFDGSRVWVACYGSSAGTGIVERLPQ